MVGLFGTLLLDQLQVVRQTLHLVISRLLVLLDVVDHIIAAHLLLLELVLPPAFFMLSSIASAFRFSRPLRSPRWV